MQGYGFSRARPLAAKKQTSRIVRLRMQRELLFRGIWDEIDEGIGTVRGSELAAADIICHITGDGQTVIYVRTGCVLRVHHREGVGQVRL